MSVVSPIPAIERPLPRPESKTDVGSAPTQWGLPISLEAPNSKRRIGLSRRPRPSNVHGCLGTAALAAALARGKTKFAYLQSSCCIAGFRFVVLAVRSHALFSVGMRRLGSEKEELCRVINPHDEHDHGPPPRRRRSLRLLSQGTARSSSNLKVGRIRIALHKPLGRPYPATIHQKSVNNRTDVY
jgi:hypothetical protein